MRATEREREREREKERERDREREREESVALVERTFGAAESFGTHAQTRAAPKSKAGGP